MNNVVIKLSLFFILYIFGFNSLAQIAGDFDNAFGEGGIVNISTDTSSSSSITKVLVQPDDKILVSIDHAFQNSQICRLLDDGSIDESYGTSGFATMVFGDDLVRIFGMKLQPDGKLLVYGTMDDWFFLSRLLGDGSIDPTFGADGMALLETSGSFSAAYDLVITDENKIIVCGLAEDSVILARYGADGIMDPLFGIDGVVTYFLGESEHINMHRMRYSIALQNTGKILVAANSLTWEYIDPIGYFGIIRFHEDGTLDHSFATDGCYKVEDFLPRITSINVLDDDKIIANSFRGIIYKLTEHGLPDSTFSEDGIFSPILGDISYGLTSKITSDGKILCLGAIAPFYEAYFVLLRLKQNGSLDSTFADDGIKEFGWYMDNNSNGIDFQSDGKIILGLVGSGVSSDHVTIVRLWNSSPSSIDGMPDISDQFQIYPNPGSDILRLSFTTTLPQIQSVHIIDMQGRISEAFVEENNTIDISYLIPGSYILQIHTDKGVAQKKFVKV